MIDPSLRTASQTPTDADPRKTPAVRKPIPIKDQFNRLQLLWKIATSQTSSEEEKIKLILRVGLDALGMDSALIGKKEGEHFVLTHMVDPLNQFSANEFCPFESLCLHTAQHGQSLFLPNLRAGTEPNSAWIADQLDIHAYIGIPLWIKEECYGSIVFLGRNPLRENDFPQEDKAFIELLGAWFNQILLQNIQQQELEKQALTDRLTGLSNRRAAELRFSEEIARAKRDGIGFSIALCDIDRFKLINDHYGHNIGDEVLQTVAPILRQALRDGDWVARWGGEEFIIFLHHANRADTLVAAERIRQAIRSTPLQTSQGPLEVTISIGIGVFTPGETADIKTVLSEADSCLYEAKNKGRDCVVAGETDNPGVFWRASVLQQALKENRIVPAYQVMVDLVSGEPVGSEALARLTRHDGPIVEADEFIHAAVGANLIHEVDRAITQQAISRHLGDRTATSGNACGAQFINLSAQFLTRRDLVNELLDHAKRHCPDYGTRFQGSSPLVFEITERQVRSDFERTRRELQPLIDFGFHLALDDFGSGHSSYLYLAELPISFLKIEGWMVHGVTSNTRVRSMVENIVALAQRLQITTIAECVEDASTADMLRDIGVDWGQGYHFGLPALAS